MDSHRARIFRLFLRASLLIVLLVASALGALRYWENLSGTSTVEELVALRDSDSKDENHYQKLLSGLEIRGRAPLSGYGRDLFGQVWSDDVDVEFGRNGCDTRNDVLMRDLSEIEIREGTNGCVVKSGFLYDPFSGQTINFIRGKTTSTEVQIDHIVALADAWQKGAQQWSPEKRRNFANDPDNLLAVDGQLNRRKGAGDAATWLPPNKSFRCDYARSIIEIKHEYQLWVTVAEHTALAQQLETCTG